MFLAACAQAERPGTPEEVSAEVETTEPEIVPTETETNPENLTKTTETNPAVSETPATDPVKKKEKSTIKEEANTTPDTPIAEVPAEVETPTIDPVVEEDKPTEIPEPAPQTAPSHVIWDGLLRKYVNATGQVNYSALKANKDVLQSYLDLLADNPPRSDWSRNEKMAYWINAYNAFTVKMIIDNYPVGSITDLHSGKPWDVKWIKIGDKTYSLNQIENEILRPIYKDARIHFAVNCAAKSCPPLLNQAFTASNLNAQLEAQAKAFINNSNYNTISTNNVKVSKIFDWYEVDFGNVVNYLNEYSNTKVTSGATINYRDYNWMLNGL
ncbi:MAG: DUF547 domain-containing protein [Saprospiraceae bacterium]|nr:DUF547 domain-containing protein [Saprospiraceae bacterium]